jgi:hypothetical protein
MSLIAFVLDIDSNYIEETNQQFHIQDSSSNAKTTDDVKPPSAKKSKLFTNYDSKQTTQSSGTTIQQRTNIWKWRAPMLTV